ncbi:hypothetical protein P3X46_008453 [Hevea brasiliensis]|uniref:J domain-containing protein n=1 Tax=Hevea brasiliensis TaxID=3981 RepID=A0ABQ9MJ39_HEVBR|nr:uncharacterized protein LOC110656909 [Hevea brasiliensis]XP_058002779.1 uncharacterized protein LOC110656909 [Hevea brasiliensis]XP_058002780.1 uncharacterized protein LOC110656909 [Hevea brasiliensis]XP_058002781.1 uncharacterized protein LOC110656909 [Hevea brasiliensis]XP_058002782.1 uncharacterized protein LOC110656909 [Hevea brasiliensis]XP_058002783.1 uncharacterized protein LOC110656909 [Hevea brasiliensis]KAJ9180176.1 hypothetical protein P3X46_008453 [Hevea brasiliensis]
MECNKEEAIRAKEIAEKKMQSGDFEGALRIALKAKKLYPDLDNISQVLMVCEVHCSAQNKLNGSEMDWYGILQIEKFSDEPIVKKQFRKLALSLHPDKNKFAGAEAAFKLIGEANRVLTDPTKRSSYDMKCRVALRSVAPKSASDQSNKNSYVKKQHGAANNFSNAPHSQFTSSHTCQQPQQTTFWTHCPSCTVKYQYYREFLNKMLRCQNCQQPFIANDLGISSRSSWSQFINEKRDPNQGPSEVAPQNDAGKPSVMNFVCRFSESDTMPKVGKSADVCGSSKPKEAKAGNASGIGGGSKPQEKVNGHVEVGKGGAPVSMSNAKKFKGSLTSDSASSKKRRKSMEESSENFDKGSSAGIEENIVVEENGGDLSAQNSRPSDGYQPRRSSRQKQHISYEENLSNDDFVDPPPKRSRGSRSSGVADGEIKEASAGSGMPRGDISAGFATYALNRNNKEVNQKATSSLEERSSNKKRKTGDFEAKGDEASMSEKAGTKLEINDENSKIGTSKLNSNETLKSEIFVCPDPNFSNFEKDRAEGSFAVNQIWAIYDSIDGMPRFYARVKKVLTPGFKLQITWLEASPDNDAEQLWCEEGLPSACGMYENGDTVETVDHPMFSHQMYCKNAGRKGTYLIYPKKGETWALFKDWDIKWSSEPDKHRPPYQFEFVEILTNFTEDLGIGVSYLDKVKGFVSIYQQANCNGVPSFYIRPSELYRFSHRIPSCRMTGQEGGVLAGSFELDTAALPSYLYNLVDLGDVKVGKEKLDAEAIGSHSKSSEHEVQPIKGSEKVCTPKNLKSGPQMGISALSISSGESTGTCKDDDQIDVDQRAKNEDCNKVARHGRLTQPEGISTSFQATEKSGSPKKREKFVSYALTPRRSPRDLSNRVDASQSTTEVAGKHTATNKDERQGQPGASSRHPDNKMHLHVKDGSSVSPAKSQKSSGCRVIEVEHYDFKKEKSEDKFQLDQIWAMHSNKDGIPRNYGQVKKIEFAIGGFKLHVAMLEAYTIRKDVQTACGTFKVKNKPVVLPVTAFSHQVKAKSIGKNRYEIYPRQGEIWAIYKIWNSDLMFSDQDAGECDIVEVVKDDENGVKVVVLMPVNGSESFYMAPRRLKSGIINITRAEFGRFSHQCLASQAMGKKDDSLRGYFELAPSSIPGTVVLVD